MQEKHFGNLGPLGYKIITTFIFHCTKEDHEFNKNLVRMVCFNSGCFCRGWFLGRRCDGHIYTLPFFDPNVSLHLICRSPKYSYGSLGLLGYKIIPSKEDHEFNKNSV